MVADGERSSRDLREHWDYIRLRMSSSAGLCILADFDGTLVELESHPDLARLTSEQRRVLQDLVGQHGVSAGVVTGRALLDLVPRVGLQGVWYVGNHGFEVRDSRGNERRFYEPEDVAYLAVVRYQMAEECRVIPGVFLEHKGPVLAVHYRQVEESLQGDVERAFLRVMDRHRVRLMISRGHARF